MTWRIIATSILNTERMADFDVDYADPCARPEVDD